MKIAIHLNFIAVVTVVCACSDNSQKPNHRGAVIKKPSKFGGHPYIADVRTNEQNINNDLNAEQLPLHAIANVIDPNLNQGKGRPQVSTSNHDRVHMMDIDPPEKTLLIGVRGLGWGFVKDHLEKQQENSFLLTLIGNGVYANEGIVPFFPTIPVPNFHSMVTGVFPGIHGVVADEFYDPDEKKYYGVDPYTYSYEKEEQQTFLYVKEKEVTTDEEGQKVFGGEPIWQKMDKATVACMYWPGCEFGGLGQNFVKFNPGADPLPWETRVQQVKTWLEDKKIKLVLMDYRDLIEHAREHGLENVRSQVTTLNNRIRDFADELGLGHDAGNRKFHLNLIIVGSSGISTLKNSKPVLPNFDKLRHDLFHVWSREPSMWLAQPYERKMGEMSEPMAKWVSQSTKTGYTIYEKAQIPEEWHYFGSDRIPDIVLVADEGVILSHKRGGKSYGDGYNINLPSMQPAFIAFGSAFKEGKTIEKQQMSTGDVHFVLLKLLNMPLPADTSSFSWHKREKYIDQFLLRQHPESPSDTENSDAMEIDTTNVE